MSFLRKLLGGEPKTPLSKAGTTQPIHRRNQGVGCSLGRASSPKVDSDANRKVWEHVVSCDVSYVTSHPEKDLQWYRDDGGPLDAALQGILSTTFNLMVGEQYELADQLACLAIEVAEDALATESFAPLYYPVDTVTGEPVMPGEPLPEHVRMPTRKMNEIAKIWATSVTVRGLHYARWFKTGERPVDLFKQFYDLRAQIQRGVPTPDDELALYATIAEDYPRAMEKCRRKVPNAVLPPASQTFRRNRFYSLLVLCEYVNGRSDLETCAGQAMGYWLEKWQNWYDDLDRPGWEPWWIKLDWAYLRGRHITGKADIRTLCKELRGY